MEAVCKNITKVSDIFRFELQIYIILPHSLSRNFVSFLFHIYTIGDIVAAKKRPTFIYSQKRVYLFNISHIYNGLRWR